MQNRKDSTSHVEQSPATPDELIADLKAMADQIMASNDNAPLDLPESVKVAFAVLSDRMADAYTAGREQGRREAAEAIAVWLDDGPVPKPGLIAPQIRRGDWRAHLPKDTP